VVFAEDHQNAYLGAAAHGIALFRNLAIGLIRLAGHTQINALWNVSPPTGPGSFPSWPHLTHDRHDFALALGWDPLGCGQCLGGGELGRANGGVEAGHCADD
jgi:hypothetical protein